MSPRQSAALDLVLSALAYWLLGAPAWAAVLIFLALWNASLSARIVASLLEFYLGLLLADIEKSVDSRNLEI